MQEARESRQNLSALAGGGEGEAKEKEEPIDWYYAQHELLKKEGIDIKQMMEKKCPLLSASLRGI